MKNPPIPKKIKRVLSNHNDKRIDWYYWLRDDDRKNKEILSYLNKENKYSEKWFKTNKVDSNKIFKYLKNSIPRFEESFKLKIDEYQYFSTSSISQEYKKVLQNF